MTQLVDTNVFIHFLVRPVGEVGHGEHAASRALFERVDRGEREIATTEACLAEIFHVLTEKHKFRVPVEEAVATLRSIVDQRGIRVRARGLYRETLDVLERHPKLGFEDALLVAHALDSGMPIVSYDRDFDRVAGITREEPSVAAST